MARVAADSVPAAPYRPSSERQLPAARRYLSISQREVLAIRVQTPTVVRGCWRQRKTEPDANDSSAASEPRITS